MLKKFKLLNNHWLNNKYIKNLKSIDKNLLILVTPISQHQHWPKKKRASLRKLNFSKGINIFYA